MKNNIIYNEDCLITLDKLDEKSIDVVLTSPPYNMTKRKGGYADTGRYDVYQDWKTEEEYINWMVLIFNKIGNVLKDNGVIIFNINYSIENPILPYKVLCEIDKQTNFALVDTIIWKKKNGIPFPANKRRLSRLFENIFIFARKNEVNTFNTNRQVKSISEKTGQKYYDVKYNHIEAANNDGKCKLNQATYSSDLCKQLLDIYALPNSTIYDPFMGTGTTAVACKQMNLNYIGSEISSEQCKYAKERIEKINISNDG